MGVPEHLIILLRNLYDKQEVMLWIRDQRIRDQNMKGNETKMHIVPIICTIITCKNDRMEEMTVHPELEIKTISIWDMQMI